MRRKSKRMTPTNPATFFSIEPHTHRVSQLLPSRRLSPMTPGTHGAHGPNVWKQRTLSPSRFLQTRLPTQEIRHRPSASLTAGPNDRGRGQLARFDGALRRQRPIDVGTRTPLLHATAQTPAAHQKYPFRSCATAGYDQPCTSPSAEGELPRTSTAPSTAGSPMQQQQQQRRR